MDYFTMVEKYNIVTGKGLEDTSFFYNKSMKNFPTGSFFTMYRSSGGFARAGSW